jgi:hypothetical protein
MLIYFYIILKGLILIVFQRVPLVLDSKEKFRLANLVT